MPFTDWFAGIGNTVYNPCEKLELEALVSHPVKNVGTATCFFLNIHDSHLVLIAVLPDGLFLNQKSKFR
jgi:hypothetical protein